jgi:hypothetical protein
MTEKNSGDDDIECALLWTLARTHGWSAEIDVPKLASDANIQDEEQGRKVARNRLSDKKFIGYHRGKDTIWLDPPPTDELAYHLRDECGYLELQIEATLDSYFDGF